MGVRKHKAGDIVFDDNGNKASYISGFSGAHVVSFFYISGDGETEYLSGDVTRLHEVYTEPPEAAKHEKIAELNKTIETQRAELRRINSELDVAGKEYQARVKKLQQHRALKRIEDYLDGKFTVFLEYNDWNPPKIVVPADALRQSDRNDKRQRLMCLFGDSNGNLEWKINDYRDGSGSDRVTVIPCESEEEAILLAIKLYDEEIEDWRQSEPDKKRYGKAVHWTKNLPNYLTAPDDIAEFIKEMAKKSAAETLARAMENLTKAQDEFVSAGGEL